ncbi:GNAT family N-acetyltransferase [Paenibacillus selenitireducens]|uniref:GNAT family N-acetyltransferase n=1 Tax=Paenibacillus selenitireducens TaxID=1324314 RepID=A0A1T2XBZ4_9BACL|nr:GNAT family N-acetyltransferase [Paenibacillus selenitireducens]OPA77409.1 GNAT family N-acetyltransferase [Paenibacillus selenitireducens]
MLETNRCRIIELHETDYGDVRKLYTDELVRKFLGGTVMDDSIFRANFFDKFMQSNPDSMNWAIRNKQNDEFIGMIHLDRHHDGVHIEVSYQLLPVWWGKGYATEVLRRVITYAFEELKLSKVIAETQTANLASCRLLESVGMTLEQKTLRFDAEQSIFGIESFQFHG